MTKNKHERLLIEIQRELEILQRDLKIAINTRPEDAIGICIRTRRVIKRLSVMKEPT